LAGTYDFDDPSNRVLVVRWNFGDEVIEDTHIYIRVNGGDSIFLGRTNDGVATYFEWTEGARYVNPNHLSEGPQFGDSYQFSVFGLRKDHAPDIIKRSDSVLFLKPGDIPPTPTLPLKDTHTPTPTRTATNTPIPPSSTPTRTPTRTNTPTPTLPPADISVNSMIVTDDRLSTKDLQGSIDLDDPSDRALVIRWNLGNHEFRDFHIYISIDGASFTFLAETNDGNASHFEWRENARLVYTVSLLKGPQFGEAYRFKVIGLRKGQLPLSIEGSGPVIFWNSALPPSTPTPTRKPSSTPTPTSIPKATATWTPTNTRTNTPTPTVTPTPTSKPPSPDRIYEFDSPSLTESGWVELPGGFGGANPGDVHIEAFTDTPFAATKDNTGLSIGVQPGEVVFIHAENPVHTNNHPVLMRLNIRARSSDVHVDFMALRGDLTTYEQVDGSIALNAPANAQAYTDRDGSLVLVYEPDWGDIFVPAIQVAGLSSAATVLIDRLEIYTLDSALYPGSYLMNESLPGDLSGSEMETIPDWTVRYEFDRSNLQLSGWAELPGGFSGSVPGTVKFINFTVAHFGTSDDFRGLSVDLNPNEVTFLYADTPIETNGNPLLIRLKVRANNERARVYLVALKGTLKSLQGVDGSIGYHSPATSSSFVDRGKDLVLVYQPDGEEPVTPVIQIVGGASGPSTIYIDRMDIFELKSGEYYSESFFRSSTLEPTVPVPTNTPKQTNTPAPMPTQTPTPFDTPTPMDTPVPTATPFTGYIDVITVDIPNLPADAKPLELALIEAGTFTMGSPADELGRMDADEWLTHPVTLTQDFYIGKYEVTQAQYEAVMEHNPSKFFGVENDRPVYSVSWNDCARFCNRLSQLAGLTPVYDEVTFDADWNVNGYRLPTEAEWEYACRSGTVTRYSFGDALECTSNIDYCELMNSYLWWRGNNQRNGSVSGTKNIGLKLPNRWGLYDMHGNVFEWCNDRWEDPSLRDSQTDPKGPSSGRDRVYRGGAWGHHSLFCRSSYRGHGEPGEPYTSLGFRLLKPH